MSDMCIFYSQVHIILQQMRVDSIELHIVRLLARGFRTTYKNIAIAVGITPSAAKKRINKMVLNSVIHNFVVVVNPVI
jgi:DNA-binding Lrp family transcriptional regulator